MVNLTDINLFNRPILKGKYILRVASSHTSPDAHHQLELANWMVIVKALSVSDRFQRREQMKFTFGETE